MKQATCLTCDRQLSLSAFPKVPKDAGCTHERETCRACWNQWLKSQLDNVGPGQVSCAQCSNILSSNDIKRMSTKIHKQYADAELKSFLSIEPDFRWCIAKDCGSGQFHLDGDIFKCAECEHKACVHCNVAWHEDETCQQYQKRVNGHAKNEKKSEKLIEQVAKLCPGCNRKVQKNGGCDHITCTICYHEFCWRCLASFASIRRVGNIAHKPDCPYHSNNIALI